MKRILRFVLLLLILPCNAAIYQSTDQDGNIIYADEPIGNNSRLLDIGTDKPTSTSSEESIQQNKSAQTSSIENTSLPHQDYVTFEVLSPKNQETVQNQTVIPIKVKIEPQLQAGDVLQIFVDDQAWGTPSPSTDLTLNNLGRGSHIIYIVIYDKKHVMVKKSFPITIFVHLASVNSINANKQ